MGRNDYWGRESTQGTYDTAQICLNGHVMNSMVQEYPESNKSFCTKCGEQTITNCPNCKSKIKGRYNLPGVVDFGGYKKDAYCDDCGFPYPWTQRTQDAAKELIEFTQGLNQIEKDDFKQSINDLMVQSAKTNLAVVKFKTYAQKAGKDVSQGLKDMLFDSVSAGVKKSIWG